MNKLSYTTYGNIVILSISLMAVIFCFIPFTNFKFYMVELILYLLEIPIYLIVRKRLRDPIHAIGLNKCYFCTLFFYFLIFSTLKLSTILISKELSFILTTILTIIPCYFTSTATNKNEEKGKLFWGFKSNIEDIREFIRFNSSTNYKLIDYENYLKENDNKKFLIYQYILKEGKSYEKTSNLLDIPVQRIYDDVKTLSHYIRVTFRI